MSTFAMLLDLVLVAFFMGLAFGIAIMWLRNRKYIVSLREWLDSETRWANHYHDEGQNLREELKALRIVANQLQRENDALAARLARWDEVSV